MKILEEIKILLGVPASVESFDDELVLHINGALLDLHQVGAVSETEIKKDDDWDVIMTEKLEAMKNFIYLKVRLVFDPPTNAFIVSSINEQLEKYEWRLCQQAEEVKADE